MPSSARGRRGLSRLLLIFALAPALLALGAGCQSLTHPLKLDDDQQATFGAVRMRIHPIFTQVKSFSGGSRPSGIQAELEFQDQFGDPTKASGTVRFELFPYERTQADHRGDRIAQWQGSLQSVEEQYLRWNKTSRTYSFALAYPRINPYSNYVLTAMFQLTDGRRFFSSIVLQGLPLPTKGRTSIIPGAPLHTPPPLPIFPPTSAPATQP